MHVDVVLNLTRAKLQINSFCNYSARHCAER